MGSRNRVAKTVWLDAGEGGFVRNVRHYVIVAEWLSRRQDCYLNILADESRSTVRVLQVLRASYLDSSFLLFNDGTNFVRVFAGSFQRSSRCEFRELKFTASNDIHVTSRLLFFADDLVSETNFFLQVKEIFLDATWGQRPEKRQRLEKVNEFLRLSLVDPRQDLLVFRLGHCRKFAIRLTPDRRITPQSFYRFVRAYNKCLLPKRHPASQQADRNH